MPAIAASRNFKQFFTGSEKPFAVDEWVEAGSPARDIFDRLVGEEHVNFIEKDEAGQVYVCFGAALPEDHEHLYGMTTISATIRPDGAYTSLTNHSMIMEQGRFNS